MTRPTREARAASTHHVVVPRRARYVTAGELDGPIEDVWLGCHGYGQLASDFLDGMSVLEEPKRVLVAAEALSRFYVNGNRKVGASWMTREERLHEIDDYIRYLDLVYDDLFAVLEATAMKLRVLGFSQGGATAARWAAHGKAKVDQLILWGETLPPELDDEALAPLRAMRVTLVAGRRDEFYSAEKWEEQRARLGRAGVGFEELTFDGGHRLDDDTLLAIARH